MSIRIVVKGWVPKDQLERDILSILSHSVIRNELTDCLFVTKRECLNFADSADKVCIVCEITVEDV